MSQKANFLENPSNIVILQSIVQYQVKWMKTLGSMIQKARAKNLGDKDRTNNMASTSKDGKAPDAVDQNTIGVLELYINGSDELMEILKTLLQGLKDHGNCEETESQPDVTRSLNSTTQNQVDDIAIVPQFEQESAAVGINERPNSESSALGNVATTSQQMVNQTFDDILHSDPAEPMRNDSIHTQGLVQEADNDCVAIQEVNRDIPSIEADKLSAGVASTSADFINYGRGSNIRGQHYLPGSNEKHPSAAYQKGNRASNRQAVKQKVCNTRSNKLKTTKVNGTSAHDRTRKHFDNESIDDDVEPMGFQQEDRLIVCYICDKRFTAFKTLKIHLAKHGSGKSFPCRVCGKVWSKPSKLKCHLRTHTGEKPFSCRLCDKKCTQKHHLTEHARIHTGEKPFLCRLCDNKFTQMSALTRHVRIHTGERPFSCKLCGKNFAQMHNLTRHVRIHTGGRPFSCRLCDKKFTRMDVLKSHVRTHTEKKRLSVR